LQEEMRKQKEAHSEALGQEQTKGREALDRLVAEQLEETRQLTSEFQNAQAALAEQLHEASERAAELQARLDARESRPEDLALIEQLKKAVREKDELVRRTYEEMKYFKLELQNREENFNKNFGANNLAHSGVRVGVMQPIGQQKGGGGTGGGGGNNGAQTMRGAASHVQSMAAGANAFAGGMGIGGGGALGVGGGLGGTAGPFGPPVPQKVPSAGRRSGRGNSTNPTPPPEMSDATNISHTPPGQPKRPSRDRQPLAAGPVLGL
jgi:hypothetical protein